MQRTPRNRRLTKPFSQVCAGDSLHTGISHREEKPGVDLPPWIYEDLYKIQSAWGVPLEALICDMFEGFISENWDLKNDRPKKLKWQIKKKPRLQSRRRRKHKFLLEEI